MNIYPQVHIDNLNVMTLKNNEILINQNVATLLKQELQINDEGLIGKNMEFSYQLGQSQYKMTCTIKDVIHEDVGDLKQIYYSYDGLNQLLKQREFSNEFPTHYSYLTHNSDFFELQDVVQIEETYKLLSEQSGFSVQHCVLSQRQENMGQKSLYQFLFRIIEIILFIVTIIYILFITIKDTARNLTSLSIIHAMGVDIKKIKMIYFKEKIKYLIIMAFLAFVVSIIITFLIGQSLLMILSAYIFICCGIYMFALLIKIAKLRQKDISIILKEGREE